MEVLNIENLSFTYPSSEKKALENVSLSVKKGEFILLCGNSGSGKTTLLRLLKKEIAPFGKIDGKIDVKSGEKIGFVGQDAENQIVSDTVWHNMAFALENERMNQSEIRRRIAEISEFFDLTKDFRRKTASLSGGKKQLLNLASVMAGDIDILILDEPTSQLDPIASTRFLEIVKRLNREMNITVIISEHRTEELFEFADKVAVMDEGRVTFFGTGEEVGEALRKTRDDGIFLSLPTPVRIYNKLDCKGACPTNASECRKFLSENFKNDIDCIKEEKFDKKLQVALEMKDVYFRYEKKSQDVLRGLNLKIRYSEIVCLLGGNGSGKTTLLSLISGVGKQYSGKVLRNAKKIAVLPQNVKSVFVKDNLSDDLSLTGENCREIAESLGIAHLLNKNPYDLSGGEAQRAALAKILLLKPDLICLDEPTKGIDAKGKRDIIKIFKDLAQHGVGIMIVTHDADFAAEAADRCMMLFDGEIVSEGTARDFFSTNKFYTTCAGRVSRHMYKNAVTVDDVVALCKRNGEKG
jgi:energy-coupling factor transport system ATP-binding protein